MTNGISRLKWHSTVIVISKSIYHIINQFFHLSGPNGAGKTTTMKMIIAEEHPTKGRIKIGPYEIESNDSKGFEYLGYCPQVWNYS